MPDKIKYLKRNICEEKEWVIKLFEGLPKFMRVSREGLALLDCQFLRV